MSDPSAVPEHLTRQRRHWARGQLDKARGTTAPPYGSYAWSVLPDGHPGKLAAAIRAAECWATTGDELESTLRREVEAMRFQYKALEDAEYQERAEAHRQRIRNTGYRPHPVNRRDGDDG